MHGLLLQPRMQLITLNKRAPLLLSCFNLFEARSGKTPYDWQLDVTEAILLGLDSMVIAGTGSGKTIPFMLPLLAHPEKMVIIISPLKVLQRDQVCDDILDNSL